MTTLPKLDADVFAELYESVCEQPKTVAALYDTFFDNAVRLIAALQTVESCGAREKTLHTLKGSAAMMGAAHIARLASDLQQTCATMQDDTLEKWIRQLDIELHEMRRLVATRLASLGTSSHG